MISGNIPLSGSDTLDFEVLQDPSHPWNALVGCAVDLSPHWQIQTEFDFNFDDMTMLVLGMTYRF